MNAPHDLEARLRSGLQAAAEALPPEPATAPVPGPTRPPVREHRAVPSRRWAITAVATAASLAAVAGAAVVVLRGDGSEEQTRRGDVSTAQSTTTTPDEPHVMQVTNGNAPGRAVVDDHTIRTFAPDGTETASIEMGALDGASSIDSDLEGGWVVCGGMTEMNGAGSAVIELTPREQELLDEMDELGGRAAAPDDQDRIAEIQDELAEIADSATTTTIEAPPATPPSTIGTTLPPDTEFVPGVHVNAPHLVWFPAEGPPLDIQIDGYSPDCGRGTEVVDSPDGPMAVIGSVSWTEEDPVPKLAAVVLQTGEVRHIPAPAGIGLPMPGDWSVNSERTIVYVEGQGYKVFDLETGDPIDTAAIDPLDPADPDVHVSHTSLAPDGQTVAVMAGTVAGPVDVIVYDLASGDELFRRTFEISTEGDQVSWDGTTLAVGDFEMYEGEVVVIDVASGDEHSLEVYGTIA